VVRKIFIAGLLVVVFAPSALAGRVLLIFGVIYDR